MTSDEGKFEADAPDPFVQRREALGEEHIKAWEQTLEDAYGIAEDRRADGWEATVVMAAHTDTVSKDMGDHDRFGLMHIIPNNYADDFSEAYDDGFTEYLVYGISVQQNMYLVIDLIDPDRERSILVPCSYDLAFAQGVYESADEAGYLPSYFKTIDGTVLGTFEHEEFDPLLVPQ